MISCDRRVCARRGRRRRRGVSRECAHARDVLTHAMLDVSILYLT